MQTQQNTRKEPASGVSKRAAADDGSTDRRDKSPKLTGKSSPSSSQGEAKEQTPLLAGNLDMGRYTFCQSNTEKTRGVCFIVFKIAEDGSKKLLMVKEDRTPIHEGPLLEKGTPLKLDGKEVRSAMDTEQVIQAESLQETLKDFHYPMIALREACTDPRKRMGDRLWADLSKSEQTEIYMDRLEKGLLEELHCTFTGTKRGPDAFSHWMYKGRHCYQPVYFVNAINLQPCANPSPLVGFYSAKAIKIADEEAKKAGFVSPAGLSNYPSVLQPSDGIWKLKCPFSETRPYHSDTSFLDDANFLPMNNALDQLRKYAYTVKNAKENPQPIIKEKTTADFGLSKWGQQLVTDNDFQQYMA